MRSADDAERAGGTVRRLLGRPLTADTAVQIALLDNKGLQAAYNELALAETDLVQQSLPPNPTFSISRIAGNGASRDRTAGRRRHPRARHPAVPLRDRARAVSAGAIARGARNAAARRRGPAGLFSQRSRPTRLVGLLTDAKSTAESTAQLAKKLGETGSLNKLDQAREQVFYAETTADLASARQEATSARERLARLMGLWGGDLDFRLPDRLAGAAAASAIAAGHRGRCGRSSHRSADRAHGTRGAGKVARSHARRRASSRLLDVAGIVETHPRSGRRRRSASAASTSSSRSRSSTAARCASGRPRRPTIRPSTA